MYSPRFWTNFTPSSNESALLLISAEYSPRLKPADISEFILFAFNISKIAKLIVSIASWVYLVSFKTSAGPSKDIFAISIPVKFWTLSYTFFAILYSLYMSFPIPTVWDPCPGNKNPIFKLITYSF